MKQTESGLYIPCHVQPMAPISQSDLNRYSDHLASRGKAPATVEKYKRDIQQFLFFLGTRTLSASHVREWIEQRLVSRTATTVNCAIAALNGFFSFLGRTDCLIDRLKVERSEYRETSKQMSREDFDALVATARAEGDDLLVTLLYTFAGTGIRVSELRYFTVETVRAGLIPVRNKGKNRFVAVSREVQKIILDYAREIDCNTGPIFTDSKGKAMTRHSIWRMFKGLAQRAGVEKSRVYPHAFRALFARILYQITKDLNGVRKALGHRSSNTTQIYLRETICAHQALLEQMRLITVV